MYNIPATFAVIPKNYRQRGQWFTDLARKYDLQIILHGLLHENFNNLNNCKSEFPNISNYELDVITIKNNFYELQNLLKDQLLPVFCPPYNSINENLEKKLIENNIVISKSNCNSQNKSIYNVDYDFCDWSINKVKSHEQIIIELIELINSDLKVIGINSHHNCFSSRRDDYIFFENLFKIFEESKKIKWFSPFDKYHLQKTFFLNNK